MTGLRSGRLGFDSRQWVGIFLLAAASGPALGPTKPHVQWVLGTLSTVVVWQVRLAGHCPPSCSEAENVWSCASSSLMFPWHGCWLSTGAALPLHLPYQLQCRPGAGIAQSV
jgi:hypothetical protein